MSALERAAALGVAALATARLTRFFTSDKLGEWLIVGRVKRWAHDAESTPNERGQVADAVHRGDAVPTPPPQRGWRSKLVSGLDCAFCVGFWLGGIVLLVSMLRRVPIIGPVVRFGLGMLALNYVVGHVSSRMDG